MNRDRGESWIKFDKVYKELTDMVLRDHRTKKHLEDNYKSTFESIAKECFITDKLYQRSHTFIYGDIWKIEFILYNDEHQQYMSTMEFPVKKWARIYKLNQLGI